MNSITDIAVEKYGAGQSIKRTEDARFLTGAGQYVEDLEFDHMVHAVFVRSPYAHADIVSMDTADALRLPGVLSVLTGTDLEAAGFGTVPTRTPAVNSDGSDVPKPGWPALAVGRARYLGEAVAVVVGETETIAREAAERVVVDYSELPSVVDAFQAVQPGAPVVWSEHPSNVCVEFENGKPEETAAAINNAAHVVKLELNNNRVTPVPMENRSAVGIWNEGGQHTLYCTTQNVHANRNQLAEVMFGIKPASIRLIAPDVGGGFGAKNALYPEYAVVLFASKAVGRPVRWVNQRTESFLVDSHGRDQRSVVELALDADGRFLALRVDSVGNLGPYLLSTGPFTPTGGSARTQGGPYRIPLMHFHARAAFSNAAPTDPYRGAGRPEASYLMDRVIDFAAQETGMDALELRRINALTADDMPWTMGSGAVVDSGDCREVLERTLKLADWDGFAARKTATAAIGKKRGIGIGLYLECSGGAPKEHAAITVDEQGIVNLAVGSQSTGMGHETTLVQILSARIGVPMENIHYHQADTDATPTGGGHGGSRGMELGGSAVSNSADFFIDIAKQYAAGILESAAADVEFGAGEFRIAGTDRMITMTDVIARAATDNALVEEVGKTLEAHEDYERDGITFPNGCQICEVEVDVETGQTRIDRFTVIDDFGVVINPMTAEGQVMGGVVQGIGQALLEEIRYDENGQLLSGSFMDYCLPRADDLSNIEVGFYFDQPTEKNPLGAKGSGEAGCCGALPAVVNAVVDALSDQGVNHLEMPLTADSVWRAMHQTAN